VRPGDVVEVREKSRKILPVENAQQLLQGARGVPEWLTLDAANLKATVVRLPERQEMEMAVDEQLIVEYYSR
jgi:small subunit ribosomal protein S4